MTRVALLLAVAAAGCAPQTGWLSGRVTYRGKPLESGCVSAVDAAGEFRSVAIGAGGTYRIPELATGPASLAVSSPDPVKVEAGIKAWSAGRVRMGEKAAPPPPATKPADWFPIPARYERPESANLSADVRPGANVRDIVLE